MANSNEIWLQTFQQLIMRNIQYWFTCTQNDAKALLNEYPQVLKALDYALIFPKAWQTARDLVQYLAPIIIQQQQGATFEPYLLIAIKRSSEEKDPVEIEFQLNLGALYRLQGRLAEAQTCFETAIALCEQYQLKTHYWFLINQMALVARLSAHYEKALAYCQQILAEQDLSSILQAEAFNIMGLVAYDQRQWQQGLSYLERSLFLYRSSNDLYQIARVLTNRGALLQRMARLDEAEKDYQEAIEHFHQINNQTEISKPMMNLGNIFLSRQNYEAAIKQYHQALPIFKDNNYSVDLAYTYNNLGLAYTGLGHWVDAEAYFKAALEVWPELKGVYKPANILDNLGKMFIKSGQFQKAHETLYQGLQVLDNAFDSCANKRLRQKIETRLNQIKGRGKYDSPSP